MKWQLPDGVSIARVHSSEDELTAVLVSDDDAAVAEEGFAARFHRYVVVDIAGRGQQLHECLRTLKSLII